MAKHRGDKIRTLRKTAKVALQEVAPRVGLSVATLGLFERGGSDITDEQVRKMDAAIRAIVNQRAERVNRMEPVA